MDLHSLLERIAALQRDLLAYEAQLRDEPPATAHANLLALVRGEWENLTRLADAVSATSDGSGQAALHPCETSDQRGCDARHAQRLEAVGRMAAGVAHEFNNALAGILGSAAALLASGQLPAESAQAALRIQDAGERAAKLTQRLLAFSRPAPAELEVVSLNDIVARLRPLLGPILGESIELRVELLPGDGFLQGQPAQLEQALVNLALNARDAMPAGGVLTVRVTRESEPAQSAARLQLSVSDTGCGMSPEVAAQAFVPFFTTKPPGQGTGLGLAILAADIRQMQGQVSVVSHPGQGSEFRLQFPETPAPTPGDQAPTPELQGGCETILVCDDHDLARESLATLLRAYGYTALACQSGRAAIALAESQRPIHLLITDVAMPEIDGFQLAAAIRQRHPHVRVLFTSGHGTDALGARLQAVEFLPKPMPTGSLLARLRALLDTPPAP